MIGEGEDAGGLNLFVLLLDETGHCTQCTKNGYNVQALGQHLDDLAESFIMSALHNGQVRTMKAHYTNDDGDVRDPTDDLCS